MHRRWDSEREEGEGGGRENEGDLFADGSVKKNYDCQSLIRFDSFYRSSDVGSMRYA